MTKKRKLMEEKFGLRALQVRMIGVEGTVDDHMSKSNLKSTRKERQMNSHYDATTT